VSERIYKVVIRKRTELGFGSFEFCFFFLKKERKEKTGALGKNLEIIGSHKIYIMQRDEFYKGGPQELSGIK
jgi:hypothetical protein